jgi:hypothetical protein
MGAKVEGINDTVVRLRKTLKGVKGDKKRKILTYASKPTVEKAKQLTPEGKPRGGVLKGAVSATYKNGTISARYHRGNLKKALRVLPLKKTDNAVIGPVIKRKATRKNYGKTDKTVNAFYAQMVFGSALAYRRRVTGAALRATAGIVAKKIDIGVRVLVKKEGRKNGFK